MPLYEYQCLECDAIFELRQSVNSPVEADCVSCGAVSRRKFSAPALIFKGAGFYVNDYAKAGKGEAPKKSAAASAATGATSTATPGTGKPVEAA